MYWEIWLLDIFLQAQQSTTNYLQFIINFPDFEMINILKCLKILPLLCCHHSSFQLIIFKVFAFLCNKVSICFAFIFSEGDPQGMHSKEVANYFVRHETVYPFPSISPCLTQDP